MHALDAHTAHTHACAHNTVEHKCPWGTQPGLPRTVLLSWKLTVPSAFAGVAAMLALTPVQYFFGRRFIALRLRTARPL